MSAPPPGSSRVSFSTRGASILAAGIATAGGAVFLGETDLLRIAVAVVVLCLGSWLYLKLSGVRVVINHLALPDEAPVGSPITVQLALTVARRLIVVEILAHDTVSEGLSPAPRLGVDPQAAAAGIPIQYRTSPRHRGVHTIGPTSASVQDPLGFAELRISALERITVLGLPRRHRVDSGWLRARSADDGREYAGAFSPNNEPDIDIREHRTEDGLRRVHWRTSARLGKLMVRPDEPIEDSSDVLVLDTRAHSHFGHSFETLIEFAASVGCALLDRGHTLELHTWHGALIAGRPFSDAASLMRALAVLDPDPEAHRNSSPPARSQRSASILITTESADITRIPPLQRRGLSTVVVLTHREHRSDEHREFAERFGESGARLLWHNARQSIAPLLARAPGEPVA